MSPVVDKMNQCGERKAVTDMDRIAKLTRKTNETDITMELNLDGSGKYEIDTGIGFLDHMLTGFAKHGFFDLKLKVKGDLFVDGHHTTEDVGIVLGQAIRTAIGDKKASNVTVPLRFRWTRRWHFVR